MMNHRLALFFIVVTLTLDAIGFGLIMPVMPDLLREVTGGDLAHAALWGGVLTGGFAVMQFLFGVVIMGEPMPIERWIGFALVWIALVILSIDALRHRRNRLPVVENP